MMWRCCWSGLGHCHSTGLISGHGISICCGWGHRKDKKKVDSGLVWSQGQNFPIPVRWNKAHSILDTLDRVVREDLSEEKDFSWDVRKCQCVLGKEAASMSIPKHGKGPGCSRNRQEASVVGVWSANGRFRLEGGRARPCRHFRSAWGIEWFSQVQGRVTEGL